MTCDLTCLDLECEQSDLWIDLHLKNIRLELTCIFQWLDFKSKSLFKSLAILAYYGTLTRENPSIIFISLRIGHVDHWSGDGIARPVLIEKLPPAYQTPPINGITFGQRQPITLQSTGNLLCGLVTIAVAAVNKFIKTLMFCVPVLASSAWWY